MNIPQRDYTLKGLCEQIISDENEVFENYHYRQVKSYFFVSDEDWSLDPPPSVSVEDYGQMQKLESEYFDRNGERQEPVFYIGPYDEESEIIALLTAETRKSVQKEILPKLNGSDNISPMPITSEDFQNMNSIMLGKYDNMRVPEFKSERDPNLADADIRPDVRRSIEYKGMDGRQAMDELRTRYGVVPVRVQYEHENVKIKIDSSGKFTLKKLSTDNFNLLFELVDEVIEDVLELKEITRNIRFDREVVSSGNLDVTVPNIEAGEVQFTTDFTKALAEEFMTVSSEGGLFDFSFTDVHLEAGSLDFSAQVMDEKRRSLFNISATSDRMKIVPQSDCSFPSLIEFYLSILRSVDGGADIQMYESQVAG